MKGDLALMKNEEIKRGEDNTSERETVKDRIKQNSKTFKTGIIFLAVFIVVSIISYCLGQSIQ